MQTCGEPRSARRRAMWRRRLAVMVLSGAAAISLQGAAVGSVGRSLHPGFVVTGSGVVAHGDGAIADQVVDVHGAVHRFSAVAVAGRKHLSYSYVVVRRGGRVHSQRVRLPISAKNPAVHTLLSPSGARVDVVVVACTGVWTSSSRISSDRLPTPKRALRGPTSCNDKTSPIYVAGVASLPGDKIAVLADPNPNPASHATRVFVGRPGTRLRPSVQQPPTPPEVFDEAFARDPSTGELIIVTTNLPAGGDNPVEVTSRKPGGSWTANTTIATVDHAYAYEASLAASNGHVVIALSKYDVDLDPSEPGVLLIDGTETGGWTPPAAPAGTSKRDVEAQIALDANGRVSLAYDRCATGHRHATLGTLYTEVRDGTSWSAPAKRSNERSIEVAWVTPAGHDRPVVGYQRFATATDPHNHDLACYSNA